MEAPNKAEMAARIEELRRALDEATAGTARLQAELAAATERPVPAFRVLALRA